MAEYNEQSGYIRQGDKPTSTYSRSDSHPVDSFKRDYDDKPRAHGMDTSLTHGARKEQDQGGLMNKMKQKLPGQHHTADGGVTHPDPNAPPKKGIMEKVKEKLPGM